MQVYYGPGTCGLYVANSILIILELRLEPPWITTSGVERGRGSEDCEWTGKLLATLFIQLQTNMLRLYMYTCI